MTAGVVLLTGRRWRTITLAILLAAITSLLLTPQLGLQWPAQYIDLVTNYEAWETGWDWNGHHIGQHDNGLFYTIDDRDGGEVSIGGHGFRPTLNSFMYGDAKAIAAISRMAGNTKAGGTL